jgi:GTP-binding protein HflX
LRRSCNPDADAQQRDVDAVLRQLDIDPENGDRIIEVWNKIDRFSATEKENLANIAARRPAEAPAYLVSAETGQGLDNLLSAIEQKLSATKVTLDLTIDASDGAGISWLHRNSEVLDKHLEEGRFVMTVRVDATKTDITKNKFGAVPSVH